MVRVKPSILPPTMMMAPTSAAARPKERRHKGKSRVPYERRDTARRADIQRREFVLIFHPRVFDGLPR
jgi:hypothetical protein